MNKSLFTYIILLICAGLISLTTSCQKAAEEHSAPPPPKKLGLLHHDADKAQKGHYTLVETDLVEVFDMEGELVSTFPGFLAAISDSNYIMTALDNDGNKLMMLDTNLNLIWEKELAVHHDIHISPDQNKIFALTSDVQEFKGKRVRFDAINCYDRQGNLLFRWSSFENLDEMMEIIKKSPCAPLRVKNAPDSLKEDETYISSEPQDYWVKENNLNVDAGYQIFHQNSVEVLKENSVYEKLPAFKPGNLLVSFAFFGFIGVMDAETRKFLWTYYHPMCASQHTPVLLPSGKILMYRNTWGELDYSSAIEIDPVSKEITWEYDGPKPKSWKSDHVCITQRLDNGNTLISDVTYGGHLYEITPEKEIVWEFLYPLADPEGYPLEIYRARRLPIDKIEKFIQAP